MAIGGLVAPLAIGMIFASATPNHLIPTRNTELFPLTLGLVLTVTALPILAKMLQESGLLKTHLGTAIMAAATVDDITAWVLLALIARSAQGVISIAQFLENIAIAFLVAVGLLLFANQFVRQLSRVKSSGKHEFPVIMVLLFASSMITEVLGLHSVLGAFMVGAVVSKYPELKENVLNDYRPVSSNLLMPVFFVLIGLKTDLTLIATTGLGGLTILFIAVGSLAKILGCFAGARVGGFQKSEALVIGSAMNLKGAVGLIVAEVGLELGVFNLSIHASLVAVVVVSTIFSPILVQLLQKRL